MILHEAIHQLVHVASAFPGHHHWPAWLHEGIAVSFESDTHRRSFGPDRDHAPRVEGFAQAVLESRHQPLTSLLSSDKINHLAGEHVGVLYDQSGSLISWLHRRKRSELAEFLSQVGMPASDGSIPTTETVFSETIGPPAAIEKRWLGDVRRR